MNRMDLLLADLVKQATNIIKSPFWLEFFSVLKILAFISSIILIIGIIILIIKSQAVSERLEDISFFLRPKRSLKNRFTKQWQKVRNLLSEEGESHWKLAVIEADKIFDNLIKEIGYAGENADERLNNIKEFQLTAIDQLKQAHQVRNDIVKNTEMHITKEEAENIILVYESALKDLGGLD